MSRFSFTHICLNIGCTVQSYELLYSQLKAHYNGKLQFNCNEVFGTECGKAVLAHTAAWVWVWQGSGLPANVRMTLLRGISFIAVGNKNRWCEPFLESLCEKFVILAGRTVFPPLCTDSPSHVPFLKFIPALPDLKLREKSLHFFVWPGGVSVPWLYVICASISKALTYSAADSLSLPVI